MAAQFVDALKGYDYFMAMRGKPSRKDVNDYLESIGRRQISRRTFEHYQGLLEHGFRSYIPINKFDVFQALGKLQMAADRRRYCREETDIHAKVSKDGIIWISAKIIDKSLVGFGIVTPYKFPLKPNNPLWVQIDNYHDIPGVLVWKRRAEDLTRFGVRCFEFIAKYLISEKEIIIPRPTGLLEVRKTSSEGIAWGEIYRIVENLNELIDASSALLYSIAEIADRKIKLASPILLSINFASPGCIKIKVDLDVANITRVVLEKVQFWSIEKKRCLEEIKRLELENDGKQLENYRRKLENANLKIEYLRNAIKLRKEAIESGVARQIADSILLMSIESLGIAQFPPNIFEPGTLEYGILTERLLPAVVDLTAGDDPEIELEAKESSDETKEK